MPDVTAAKIRLERVRGRIGQACAKSGRNPAEVTLVAVSKTHTAEDVYAMAQAGQNLFGESYVQEALPKMDSLAGLAWGNLHWHFIGRLQKNKAKYVAGRFDLIHSVDSLEMAHMLHKNSASLGVVQPVLLQVNLACETSKAGCSLEQTLPLVEAVAKLEALALRGLMLLPPWFEDPEANRWLFAQARELKDDLTARLGLPLPELSMGMSHDLEQAVEEGATLVRVGTDLFGERKTSK